MSKKNYYPEEVKWKVVEMKKEGRSNREIMETFGIKNVSQIKKWMKWEREGETYRFSQSVGKQYSYGKGLAELSELEQEKFKNRQLEMQLDILKKYKEIERSWYHK